MDNQKDLTSDATGSTGEVEETVTPNPNEVSQAGGLDDPGPIPNPSSGSSQLLEVTNNDSQMVDGVTDGTAGGNPTQEQDANESTQGDNPNIQSEFMTVLKRLDEMARVVRNEGRPGTGNTFITAEQVHDALCEANNVLHRLWTGNPPPILSVTSTPSGLNFSNASTEYMSMPLTEAAWQEAASTNQGIDVNTPDVANNTTTAATEIVGATSRRSLHGTMFSNDLTGDHPTQQGIQLAEGKSKQSTSNDCPRSPCVNELAEEALEFLEVGLPQDEPEATSKKSRKTNKARRIFAWSVNHLEADQDPGNPPRSLASPSRPDRPSPNQNRVRDGREDPSTHHGSDDSDHNIEKKVNNSTFGRNVNSLMMSTHEDPTPEELELYDTVKRVRALVEREGHQAGIDYIKRNFLKSSSHYGALIEAALTTRTQAATPRVIFPVRSREDPWDPSRNIDPARRPEFTVSETKIDPTKLSRYLPGNGRPLDRERLPNPDSNNGNGLLASDNFQLPFNFGDPAFEQNGNSSAAKAAMVPDDETRQKKAKKNGKSRDKRFEDTSRDTGSRYGRPDPLYPSNSYDNLAGPSGMDCARQSRNNRAEKPSDFANTRTVDMTTIRRMQKHYEEAVAQQASLARQIQSCIGNNGAQVGNSYNNGQHNPSLVSLEQRLERLASDIVMRDEERNAQIATLKHMIRNLTSRLDMMEINTNRVLSEQDDINQRLSTLASDNDLHRRMNDVLRRCSLLETMNNQTQIRADVYDSGDNVNLRSNGSAFRRPERNNMGRDDAASILHPGGWSSWLPTNPQYLSNIPAVGTSALGMYPSSLNSHLENHHSNLMPGAGMNNINREGNLVFNPTASFGYHPHNSSAGSYGTGSGQHVLNNLTLNNQIPQPRPRANNYWDNFRSYSRQNLLSSPKMNGPVPASCNVESRMVSSSFFPGEELNNQAGTTQLPNNTRPDLVVNRNPVGNGSKSHLRSPQFVENIASSKKKNKDQSHVLRLNSTAPTGISTHDHPSSEDRTEMHSVQEPGSSAALYRTFRVPESNLSRDIGANDAYGSSEMTEQVNRFLDDNVHRPTFVRELLQKLSALSSDGARQRALNLLQGVANDDMHQHLDIAGLESPPQSPVRIAAVQPQAVVVPFSFNRTDEDENVETEAQNDHGEASNSTNQQSSNNSMTATTSTTTVTTASGLRLTRVTRAYAGPRENTSSPPRQPARAVESNESMASSDYNFTLDEFLAYQQAMDSDDGEIHDLMDLAEEAEAARHELPPEERANQVSDPNVTANHGRVHDECPEADHDQAEANDEAFVPIRF